MSVLVEKITENAKKIQQDHPNAVLGAVGAAVAVLVLRAAIHSRKVEKKKDSIPLPSPRRSLPFIGHALSLYPSPHLQMIAWAEKLGPIYQISLGSSNVIVLNNNEVARDLLEINGQLNSDRNANVFVNLMSAHGSVFAWGDDTPYLRKCRRLLLGSVSKSAIEKKYPELHNEETLEFMQNVYKHGTQPEGCKTLQYVYLYTTNLAMRFLCGCHYKTFDDPEYRELLNMAENFADLANYLLIEYPKSTHFLLGRLKQWAIDTQAEFQKVIGRYNSIVRDAIHRGEEIDCLMTDMFKVQEKEELSDVDLANMAATAYIAAVDTTALTMQNLILVLVNRPEIQSKIHDELERVVGDRMPSDQDLKDLPYLEAVVTEILRFRPAVLLNLPHSASKRQVYNGYEIPEGTVYIHNIYGCNRDPAVYSDPDTFNPDRFYNPDVQIQRAHWTFGAGRRLCPGNQFAEKSLYLMTARLLWAFNLTNPLDANGNKIQVPISDVSAPITHPPDINVALVPRQKNLAEALSLA
ncbi:hypothetical protein DFQ28_006502 [Apophysomyces sp. BC1034]|nr:hypothetical protein DFQ28_006502 [Apophysomyces sp. BC1034]